MKRREFIRKSALTGAVAGSSLLAAPAVHASDKVQWKMVTTWPKNFPGLGTGANKLAEAIGKLAEKKLVTPLAGGFTRRLVELVRQPGRGILGAPAGDGRPLLGPAPTGRGCRVSPARPVRRRSPDSPILPPRPSVSFFKL